MSKRTKTDLEPSTMRSKVLRAAERGVNYGRLLAARAVLARRAREREWRYAAAKVLRVVELQDAAVSVAERDLESSEESEEAEHGCRANATARARATRCESVRHAGARPRDQRSGASHIRGFFVAVDIG